MIIPILLSVIFYNEVLTPGSVLGIVLTFVSFYLNIDKTNNVLINKKWIIFAFLAFIFNSATVIAQKIYTNSFFTANSSSFVALGFSFATIFCAIILFILKLNKKECSYKPDFKIVSTACTIGLILGFFQILNTCATRIIDGTVLFPSYNGGTLVLTTIISTLLYKERLNYRQRAGMVIGIAAIILISI
ncbi:MAG: EamA family transporter [Clostridia bacterium]|nr:EamA family transporter [Clostridia bacterium]